MGPKLWSDRACSYCCGIGLKQLYKSEGKKTCVCWFFTVVVLFALLVIGGMSGHTFVHQIQNLIDWIDNDARHLQSKEEVLDGVKIRILVMARQ